MFFKIVMVSRSVKHDFMGGLSFAEAQELCEFYNWEYMDENGFVWDLEIEDDVGY